MNGQEYPAWSRDWSAPSDFDAPTGPIPVPVVVRAEQAAGGGDVQRRPHHHLRGQLPAGLPADGGRDLDQLRPH